MRKSEMFLAGTIIVCSFLGGVKYSLYKLNEETSYWAKQYKETDDKVSAYIKVSDPKTVRLYIKQLNDLLDNMTRLGKIIDNGEEVDLALARIEKEYIILGQQVKMMITEINNNLFTLKEEQLRVDADLNDLFDADMDDTDKLTLVDNKIMNRIKVIQTDLDTIRSLIKDIQETKFDKLW
tara:strand:- start:303 stop:842 length:540 start_codon:yes stop_codon:yes gene_type:complete